MMKKVFLLLVALVSIALGLAALALAGFGWMVREPEQKSSGKAVLPLREKAAVVDSGSLLQSIEVGGEDYRYAAAMVDEPSLLRLFPNFTTRAATVGLLERKQCELLVNGGFYDTDNEPIGWFVSEGEELSESEANDLFDGFVSLYYDGRVDIGLRAGTTDVRGGLQSGPLLILNGRERRVTVENDRSRRRVIMGLTDDDEVFFLVLVSDESLNEGPTLADTGGLVSAIAEDNDFAVEAAINLDGGSASAFYANGVEIREMTIIGSYFCLSR